MTRALELTRAELACAVETLAAAADAGHDAHGRPLNGILRSGLTKLRHLWRTRYETRCPKEEAVTARELRTAFADAGEVFPADLTGAVVMLTRDIHFDNDETLGVLVFGKGGMEEPPVWEVEHRETAHLLAADSVEQAGGVGAAFVLSLFSGEVRQALAAKGLSIVWNPGWSTEEQLDPLDEEPDGLLLPEEG